MIKNKLAAIILAASIFMGCASKTYVVHPGSASTFDSQAYDSLLVAQAAIDEGKAEYTANTLPDSSKKLLNDAIGIYNIAETAWHSYHDAALNAKAGNQQQLQAQLTDDLNKLAAAIAQFEQSLGKKAASAAPTK